MFYQSVLGACWFIPWQAALKSHHSYTSILSQCWPGCHSGSHAIIYKDWSGTSPNQTGPPKLVGSSHRHQPGGASLVLPPRLDRSDYSEPCPRIFFNPLHPFIHPPAAGLPCTSMMAVDSRYSPPSISSPISLSPFAFSWQALYAFPAFSPVITVSFHSGISP